MDGIAKAPPTLLCPEVEATCCRRFPCWCRAERQEPDDCRAAQGCLFLDTFHLPQKKVKVSFCHSHFNFLCCIYLSLFLINSVTSDFICEKLYSSQSGLSYILITNNPQISMAQNNKGFFLTLSHDHA